MEKSSKYLIRAFGAILLVGFYFGLPYVEKDPSIVTHEREIMVITVAVVLFMLNVRQYFKAKALETKTN